MQTGLAILPPFSRSFGFSLPPSLGNRPRRFPCHFLIAPLAALWRFSQAPLSLSLEVLRSPFSFRPSSVSLSISPSFLFLGINRSRWEDSSRGERIRLPSSLSWQRTQKLPSRATPGRPPAGRQRDYPLLAMVGVDRGSYSRVGVKGL